MNEFRFLVGAIVIFGTGSFFACGLKVVENRHNARNYSLNWSTNSRFIIH